MASRVVGGRRLARVLRKIEPEVRPEVGIALNDISQAIHADMLSSVAVRTGRLAGLLRWRVAKNELRARVGLITTKARKEGFYALFLEKGTKGYPPLNIPPMAAQPFIGPAFDTNKRWALERMRKAIRSGLRAAVAAGGPRD